ncbi:cellulase family glycosylhydrolase [Candidatus Pacearchaeota archaeon]|nr:cellulase family glycosylhydrolase [Candidatus Pacearchaeota archaeon]
MEKLIVNKNKIVNEKGKEVILKGACLIDPALTLNRDNHFSLKDLKNIKDFGFNTVKIVIVPSMFQSRKDYCKEFLDKIVSECKKIKLYCWIDWHAHGNPLVGETRSPEILDDGFMRYDSKKEVALDAWKTLSKRYGKEEHVIFEIFANPLCSNWNEWKEVAEELIKEIRKYSDNIISVSGVNFMADLSDVLKNPLKEKNIIYSVAIYPNYEVDKKIVAKVKKEYPVNIVECGFIGETHHKVFEGSKKEYAIPLNKFLRKNNIGFMAWVYHPFGLTSKASVLINSWNPNDLSEWGKFVKEELLNKTKSKK